MASGSLKTRITASIFGAALATVAFTNTQADPMNVTASVDAVCELGTIGDVAFGTLTPGSGNDVTATGTIQWRCSLGTDADISINDGVSTNRTMPGPAATPIAYELYKENTYTDRWGDTGAQLVGVTGLGMVSYESENVFGEVLHADYVGAEIGAYSDIVTIDITVNP